MTVSTIEVDPFAGLRRPRVEASSDPALRGGAGAATMRRSLKEL